MFIKPEIPAVNGNGWRRHLGNGVLRFFPLLFFLIKLFLLGKEKVWLRYPQCTLRLLTKYLGKIDFNRLIFNDFGVEQLFFRRGGNKYTLAMRFYCPDDFNSRLN